jgi:uncharacterized protein (DUF2252 family)
MSLAALPMSPVDEILHFNRDRRPKLVRLKYRRMAGDPFSFFRATDHLFARAWPDLHPDDLGPEILLCGDLHLENFGAYRVAAGEDRFDINDFDEALVAPCSFDVARCATSILLALQLWRLTPLQTAGTLLAFLDHYRAAVVEAVATGVVGEVVVGHGLGPVERLLGAPPPATQAQMLDRHTRMARPGRRKIRRDPAKHPAAGAKRKRLVTEAVEAYGKKRGEAKEFKVLDVRGRIAGLGSLGLRRYTALIVGRGSPDHNGLLDLKELRPSSVLGCTTHSQPDHGGDVGRRVVEVQRQLQAVPPRILDSLTIDGLPFRLREMVPDENRSSLDALSRRPNKLRRAVEVAGRVAGWSHVRGSRLPAEDRSAALRDWAAGPALGLVMAAATRFAERTLLEFAEYRSAYRAGRVAPEDDA